jgi:hypothetical protein
MFPKFDVPGIPYELVAESKRKARKVWNRQDAIDKAKRLLNSI